jgi:hypothetical protein
VAGVGGGKGNNHGCVSWNLAWNNVFAVPCLVICCGDIEPVAFRKNKYSINAMMDAYAPSVQDSNDTIFLVQIPCQRRQHTNTRPFNA